MALRLGTRGSKLALAQAQLVADAIGGVEVVPVKTDDGAVGDKERFIAGIERALIAGEVDLAVHSAKDLPTEATEGLEIAAVPQREDPRDVYCGFGKSVAQVPDGARVGTSSLRRRSQLLALRPDLNVTGLRGNVDTRLRKLAEGELDGMLLALAGLHRLRRVDEVAFEFDPEQLTPAPGQGSLVVQARAGEAPREVGAIADPAATAELAAERAAVTALEADCDTPVGVFASLEGEQLRISGFAGLPDGSEWVRDRLSGGADDPEALGRELGERMLVAGAREILAKSKAGAR